jgi:hypothetical protein
MEWRNGGMVNGGGWNGRMAEWLNCGMADGMAEWRDGGMADGMVEDGMAEWWNGGMAEW